MLSKALGLLFWLLAGVLLALALARSAPAASCMTRSECLRADAGYCRYRPVAGERCWYPGGHRQAERHNPVLTTRPIVRPMVEPYHSKPAPVPVPVREPPPPPRPLDSLGPIYALPLIDYAHRMLARTMFDPLPPPRVLDPPPPMPVVLEPESRRSSEDPETAEYAALEAQIWPPIARNDTSPPTLARLLFLLLGASLCGACAWGATGPWQILGGNWTPTITRKKLVANVTDAMIPLCGVTVMRRWGLAVLDRRRRRRGAKTDIEIGERLRRFRIELGLTQEAVALQVGITAQQVHKYETGRDAIASTRLKALCKALGITPNDLIGAC